MAQSVNLWGATYSDVPAIEVPKSGGGMASFTDVTDTTAAASDVATGKYFYTAAGVRTQGTGSGGGGGYVTQDQNGYIVLPSTGGGSSPTIQSLTVTPSTSQQTFNASGVDGYKPVTVDAMPSGTAGTPTATKGTVSNHSVSVTPSVTNTTGYITGSTKTGTAVTVSASELVSGNLPITQNGNNIDCANYSTVSVNVSGSPSATQHTIHLEFSDSTDTDIPVYYNDSVLGTIITAYEPSVWAYSNKTVTLAQLDGTTWYEPAQIPLNTQLIDYTAVKGGYYIDGSDGAEHSQQWACCSDFTKIDPSMTFSFVAYQWFDMAFYDSSKTYISGVTQGDYADTIENDYAHGTLSGNRIPSNAVYVRFSSYPNAGISSAQLSLIRTA